MELSALKPALDELDVPLAAVLHEELGAKEFQEFFKVSERSGDCTLVKCRNPCYLQGPLFLDAEKKFYGPDERRMLWMGFIRLSMWSKIFGTIQKDIPGNLEGDGTLLGGVFVLGPKDTGVVFEHRQTHFADYVNTTEVLEAVRKMKSVK